MICSGGSGGSGWVVVVAVAVVVVVVVVEVGLVEGLAPSLTRVYRVESASRDQYGQTSF